MPPLQHRAALGHHAPDEVIYLAVFKRFVYRGVTLQPAIARRDGVRPVEREELALKIRAEVVHKVQPVYRQYLRLYAGLFNVPLVVFFHDDVARVRAALVRRDYPVDRAVWKADVFLGVLPRAVVKMFIYVRFQLARPADRVLHGDDVHGRGYPRRGADGDALRDRRGDLYKRRLPHTCAHKRHIRVAERAGERGVERANGGDVAHGGVDALRVHHVHGVLPAALHVVYHVHVDVREQHVVARLLKLHADEAAPYLSCAYHDRFVHFCSPCGVK